MSTPALQAAARQELLAAARNTTFYRRWLAAAAGSTPNWLHDAPLVTVRDLYEHREAFRNQRAEPAAADFRYPLQPPPRCAILTSGFRAGPNVRVIPNWRQAELRRWAATTAIAAPAAVLRSLARESSCELLYPVVAFTGPCHGLLSDADRDLIWTAFRVPVYEQFLGVRNELLAEECDAHDGLHVCAERVSFAAHGEELVLTSLANLAYPVLRLATGLHGRTEQHSCACGRSGLKLVDLRPMAWTLAATA